MASIMAARAWHTATVFAFIVPDELRPMAAVAAALVESGAETDVPPGASSASVDDQDEDDDAISLAHAPVDMG